MGWDNSEEKEEDVDEEVGTKRACDLRNDQVLVPNRSEVKTRQWNGVKYKYDQKWWEAEVHEEDGQWFQHFLKVNASPVSVSLGGLSIHKISLRRKVSFSGKSSFLRAPWQARAEY